MPVDEIARYELNELRKGHEDHWEKVVMMVSENRITKQEAYSALEHCLPSRIKAYADFSSDAQYWQSRITEARTAQAALQSGARRVTYKGITL